LFAEIKVWTNSAFISNTADTIFISLAGDSITMDMRMSQIVTREERVEHRWEMLVDYCKWMVRMNRCGILNTSTAKIVIATFETLMSHTNDGLKSARNLDLTYFLALIAMSTMLQSPARTETLNDLLGTWTVLWIRIF
jgi:hypothetical protein